jgi:hypothetical protein
MPTFSKEDGGSIKAFNNYMIGQRRFVAYADENYPESTIDFDAYVASSRDEVIGDKVVSSRGSNKYNNFDTNAEIMYDYVVDAPEEAKDKLINYAGRMNSGDFNWSFNNTVDDRLYAVNVALKSALVGYTTNLLAVQDDGVITPDDNDDEDSIVEITGDVIHNFTTDGLNSTFFSISGNLSDSKGTVSYSDQSFTECLKIESATLIEFTTSGLSKLTLVFNENFNEEIKVDGVSYTVTSGVLAITIEAGIHTITKDDVANLYLTSIDYVSGISGLTAEISVKVHPNPTSGILYISSLEKITTIKLYSARGELMKQYNGNREKIFIAGLQPGVYFLEINVGNKTSMKRVVKL